MPKTTAISLARNLEKAIALPLRHRFDAEARRISVGTNHGNRVARLPFVADGEGDDGGAIAGEVVFASWMNSGGPRVALLDVLEARLFQAFPG